MVERYVIDPFGQATALDASWNVLVASAFAWVYLHQGGRFDATTGLYHFRQRDYSPTLGRWTSLDPIRYDAGDVNLYRAIGNGLPNRLDPLGLADWELKWEWHHMFPNEFKNQFPNFDFDAIENGRMVRGGPHRGPGDGIHSKGWNEDWAKWIDEERRAGRPITPESIKKRAEEMMTWDKYKDFFEGSMPATERYDVRLRRLAKEASEKAAREAAEQAAKKATGGVKGVVKRVGKRIPFIGIGVTLFFWGEDVQAKGWVGGTVNSALDAVPIFGTVKGGIELFTGDWIPDKK